MYLLDTNVVSELRKPTPHGAVLAWYNAQQVAALALPSIAIYELHSGANRTRQQDIAKAEEIDLWIESILARIAVLPFGSQDARLAAAFMAGRPVDLLPDAMIAATAAVYGLTVVTRNTRDFEAFPVRSLNPFLPQTGVGQ